MSLVGYCHANSNALSATAAEALGPGARLCSQQTQTNRRSNFIRNKKEDLHQNKGLQSKRSKGPSPTSELVQKAVILEG